MASTISGGNGRYSDALSINDHGQIVGISYTHARFYELQLGGLESIPPSQLYDGHATLWQNGTATTLPSLSGQYAYANDINNHGQIVGWSLISQNQAATIWNNGLPTALSTPTGLNSEAHAINDNGYTVGVLRQGNSIGDAALWNSNNELILLDTIGGNGSGAYAINNANIAAGWSESSDGRQHATLWENGLAIDLGRQGDYASFAYGLNNLGHVVGSFIEIDGTTGYLEEYAALWIDGNRINLNSLIDSTSGIILDSAYGINDQGWIIARGTNNGDTYSTYLLMPVPEPSTYAMLLAGLGLLMSSSRRKSHQ